MDLKSQLQSLQCLTVNGKPFCERCGRQAFITQKSKPNSSQTEKNQIESDSPSQERKTLTSSSSSRNSGRKWEEEIQKRKEEETQKKKEEERKKDEYPVREVPKKKEEPKVELKVEQTKQTPISSPVTQVVSNESKRSSGNKWAEEIKKREADKALEERRLKEEKERQMIFARRTQIEEGSNSNINFEKKSPRRKDEERGRNSKIPATTGREAKKGGTDD